MRTSLTFCILFGLAVSAWAQDRIISGKVISAENGIPVPGVNVVLKGTTIGTATDVEGRYALNIESGAEAILVFSFVGYNTLEKTVGELTVLDIQLTLNTIALEEVVVTGYTTISKKDLSSSIAVVDVKDMQKFASSNFADQLLGKVAGVQISTSGDPASVQYVRIRGIGTINNNEPLYVIDGVPVQNETDMNFLNPNDIETMQVLKDAAAASIYGARAANGVIVITTKRGAGQSKLNVDFFTGLQNPQRFPEMANPSEMLEIQKGLSGTSFNSTFYVKSPSSGNWVLPDFLVNTKGYLAGDPLINPSKYVLNTSDPSLYSKNFPIATANKEGTNWFKELFKPASMTSVQLSASGGNEKGSHYFSMNYFDHNGILIKNKWQRLQTRLNSTFSVGKNFRVGENLNVALQGGTGGNVPYFKEFNQVLTAYSYPSIVPVSDINGFWAAASQSSFASQNPVADQRRTANGYDFHSLRLTGNAFAEIDFLKSFTFRANAGLDYFQSPTELYRYTCPECGSSSLSVNSLYKDSFNKQSWVLTGTLIYNRIVDNHSISALVGAEARNAFQEYLYASGTGLAFGDDPYYRELSNAQPDSYSLGSNRSNSRMLSAFANVNYTYNGKYIVAATLRRDGSSKFIRNKYGMFPAISAAWRISKEPFFSSLKFITDLKLRASYGITGNNEVVGGDYPGYSTYGTSPRFSSYAIDGSWNKVVQGFAQVSSGNPELKWETCALTNLAFDATLTKNLDLTLEWYNRKTTDMIFGVEQPLETGNLNPINRNIGSMVNKGIDLQMLYRGKGLSQKFSYTIGLTGTHFTNKVLALSDSASFVWGTSGEGLKSPITRTQAGYPVSQFYGYVAEGLWQSQSEINSVLFASSGGAKPGRMKFRDVNGDGMITDKDRTFIGNPIPKFILGLNVTLNYKNFDLTSYFTGVFGVKVFNVVKSYTDFNQSDVSSGGENKGKRMLYEAGKTLPALDGNDTYSGKVSSYFVEDGSCFRLRNVVVGYTFPSQIISKVGLSRARIYLQAQNLFTWTKYSGLDPDATIYNKGDVTQQGRDLTTGVDVGHYPWSRQFIIGVNIEF